MEYINLGTSGLKVSRICLGMMTYGSPKWRPWVLDKSASRPFIRKAIEAGINFFDTANSYSNGLVGNAYRKIAQGICQTGRNRHSDKSLFPCFRRCYR